VPTSQACSQSFTRKWWAGHTSATLNLSTPALPMSQGMTFGLLWCKHSHPGIAVDLVRPVFTLELRYFRLGGYTSTTGCCCLPSPCGTYRT
jgi:hypothetical protein